MRTNFVVTLFVYDTVPIFFNFFDSIRSSARARLIYVNAELILDHTLEEFSAPFSFFRNASLSIHCLRSDWLQIFGKQVCVRRIQYVKKGFNEEGSFFIIFLIDTLTGDNYS